MQDMIHKGPYNEIGNWDYAGIASAIWQEAQVQPSHQNDHKIFAAKVQSLKELDAALVHVQLHDSILAVLECCVDPARASLAVQKFGSKLVHDRP